MERAYSVEVIGFNATERIVLGSIFNLSARRTPRYVQYQGGVTGRPDLILSDTHDTQYIEQAKILHGTHDIPVILVGDRDFGTGWPVVARPLQWARLFRAFDLGIGVAAPDPQTAAPVVPGSLDPANATHAAHTAPRAVAPVTQPTAVRHPTRANPVRIPGAPWVLVVDDSAPVREFMKEVLAPLQFNIDTADSGEKAIGMTAGRDYACIFLDVMLPGVDGYQVCKLIKSKPTGKRTPVIMLTSRGSPFDRIRGSMAGCDSYLTKPVEEEKLRAVVTKILAAHGHGAPALGRA